MLDMKEQARPASVTDVKAQLEQLLAPTSKQPAQIEPTIKAQTKQQEKTAIAPASPAQYTPPSSQQQPQDPLRNITIGLIVIPLMIVIIIIIGVATQFH
jgi:ABC-type Na+ efflux pump permease subunit